MTLKEYVAELDRQYRTGLAREHSYRPALQQLLSTMLPHLTVTNEPARVACGAPDYILTGRGDGLPVAFVEAKDIDDGDLDGRRQHREQFDRYRASLDHIVFTDYMDFHLYEHGELVDCARIAQASDGRIKAVHDGEDKFAALIARLGSSATQRITSAGRLAEQMASKARLLAGAIRAAFEDEAETYDNRQLQGMLEAFRQVLIHDLTPEGFADIYAQTIAYGMFAARLHDDSPETFSRQEAATLIPRTNPFLRRIFHSIAGYDLDERIAWIVDDLATMFRATDMARIMEDYGRGGRHDDPMIHFYEDFLSVYDPRLRKAKGVWYTPASVVTFIVRAVDEVLRRDFGLAAGLADHSTVEREMANDNYVRGKRGMTQTVRRRFHKVQILDPATGTGTFLAEVVKQVHAKFAGMEGMWQGYVAEHLLPRLNGFELLMASYAIAHLKLDLLLTSTGYVHGTNERLRIYLTNSLEECHPDTGTIFAQWLSSEASEANIIKRDTPVMVMMGNPPYSISSNNNGEWITGLVADYKRDLGERNIQPLSDDYIKFIRLGQHYIERNGEGILAFITNNSYIDGIIHRRMRQSLLEAFDTIYIIDLHGNAKKRETAPDGGKDENVFDIQQGVCIAIFVKTGRKAKDELARVLHHDLFGKRQEKYDSLASATLANMNWTEVKPQEPYYFFVPKDFSAQEEYEKGVKLDELFMVNVSGIKTSKDNVNIQDGIEAAQQLKEDALSLPDEEFREKYKAGADSRDWSVARAKADVEKHKNKANLIREYCYRPFDTKFLVYTGETNGLVAWPRGRFFLPKLSPRNLWLQVCRQQSTFPFQHVFIAKGTQLVDMCTLSSQTKETNYAFPLLKEATPAQAGKFFGGNEDTSNNTDESLVPNFSPTIYNSIKESLGCDVEPLELFDYIYAVLHCPTYRERYREMLRIDFPRIPYPTDTALFHALAAKGTELRRLHLMEDADRWTLTTTYPASGNDTVDAVSWDDGRVIINAGQWFGNVSQEAWEMYIGGYQPAQKWLKDRRGRRLTFDDILHYRRIIAALDGTRRVMDEIDKMWKSEV